MIISTKPITLSSYDAVEVTSDAPNNEEAIREIDRWSIYNNASRSKLHALVEQPNAIGGTYRTGIVYPAKSTSAQGHEIYDRKVVPTLSPVDIGRYVVIDCNSEDFVISDDEFEALDSMAELRPAARTFVKRVGYKTVGAVGASLARSYEV